MSATYPSPDAQPRASSAWRVPIIALVAILAVAIGAVVGSFLLTARSGLGSAGAAAGYVPAGAPMYVEFRLIPSEAQDAALRSLLARFPPMGLDADEPIADQLIALLDEQFGATGVDLSYANDVAPWFDGRVAIAVNELPPTPDPMSDPMTADPMDLVPSVTVMLGVTDVQAATATAERLRGEIESAGTTFTSTDHQGTAIWSAGSETPGAYAIADDQLLVATSAADIQTALDVHAGRQPGMLSATEELGPLAERLPDDWLFFMALNGEALTEAVRAESSAMPGMGAFYDALIADQPLHAVMAAYATEDGLAIDAVTSAPTGDLALENRDRGLAAQLPADAIYFGDAGNLGVGLARFVEAIKAQFSALDESTASQLEDIEASLDASLEDFVSWMDDGAIAVGFDGSEPWGGMVITANDAAAASDRLDQLAGLARLAALDPTSGISVSDETVAGAEVTTISVEIPAMVLGSDQTSVAVQYTVTDERVLVGIGDSFVGRALELDAADSLAQNPRFRTAIDPLGGPENAAATFLDLTALRVAVEGTLGDMGVDSATYEEQVKPWLAPLDYLVAVTRVEGDTAIGRVRLVLTE